MNETKRTKKDGYFVRTTNGEHWFPFAKTAAQARRIAITEARIPKADILSVTAKIRVTA